MFIRRLLAAGLLLLGTLGAHAHDPGLSSAKLTLADGILRATLTFAPGDIDALSNGEKLNAAQLEGLAKQSLEIWFDGHQAQPTQATARTLANKDVEFQLLFPAAAAARIRIRSTLLDRLPFGHRQYLSFAGPGNAILVEKLLSGSANEVEAPLGQNMVAEAPVAHPFMEFLGMGIKHILTGYDHMLFLFALLIACQQVSSFIKVITAFTLGHSISLALATLGWVEIPSRIVEPLIAVTIIYVAVDNLIRRRAVSHRALLTFAFGLVHGFGFAGALRDMGVGSNGGAVAVPLLAFNSGVEIGQLIVAAAILPVIWSVEDKPQFAVRWAPACSMVVALAGSYWFVQRVWIN
jgi:hypothetical protein